MYFFNACDVAAVIASCVSVPFLISRCMHAMHESSYTIHITATNLLVFMLLGLRSAARLVWYIHCKPYAITISQECRWKRGQLFSTTENDCIIFFFHLFSSFLWFLWNECRWAIRQEKFHCRANGRYWRFSQRVYSTRESSGRVVELEKKAPKEMSKDINNSEGSLIVGRYMQINWNI